MTWWPWLAYFVVMTTATSRPRGLTPDQAFGRAVNTVMFGAKLTQTRLAKQLGMHQTALSKKLHGERPWTLAEMIQVADILGVDLRELLGTMWNGPGTSSRTPEFSAGGLESTRRKTPAKGIAPVIPIGRNHERAMTALAMCVNS